MLQETSCVPWYVPSRGDSSKSNAEKKVVILLFVNNQQFKQCPRPGDSAPVSK